MQVLALKMLSNYSFLCEPKSICPVGLSSAKSRLKSGGLLQRLTKTEPTALSTSIYV